MSRLSALRAACAAASCLLIAGATFAADDPMMSQMPQPGPQHKILASRVGTWKTTVKMYMAPGQPPMVMEGVETIRPLPGGTWFITNFKADGPMPFEGVGTEGFDAKKGMFVGTWTDSWSASYFTTEGPESDGASLTLRMTGPGMNGEIETTTMVETLVDANHRSVKSFRGPDVSGDPTMTIEYARVAEKPGSTAKDQVHSKPRH